MGVMTAPTKKSEQDSVAKKCVKARDKTRPITATLEHPLILDIKLLKKLDMTTFTKKGLIALSKFCGISLINKTDSKRKLNKCVKTIQYLNKQTGCESRGVLPKCPSSDCTHGRPKRKPGKQISRAKPRIRFKISEEGNSQEEDSSDVVCKRHDKLKALSTLGVESKLTGRKAIMEEILGHSVENIIPEPCKTCSRSEHPERLHSHPKMSLKLPSGQSMERNLEERFKNVLTTKDSDGRNSERRKRQSAKNEFPQDLKEHQRSPTNPQRPPSMSPMKSSSSAGLPSPETGNKGKSKTSKKPPMLSVSETKSTDDVLYLKKTNPKNVRRETQDGDTNISVEDAMKFVTGCYVCGRQVSPKSRIKHEESCIAEWRTRNNVLSPNERKPEPRRPDFRFTAGGDLDCQGTFESIWANHKESLVPCKKCGRTFFPDRIERHENACNNTPIAIKYKH